MDTYLYAKIWLKALEEYVMGVKIKSGPKLIWLKPKQSKDILRRWMVVGLRENKGLFAGFDQLIPHESIFRMYK